MIDEVRPFDGARELMEAVKAPRLPAWCWPARASRNTSSTSST